MLIEIDRVSHVGSLDPASRTSRPSLEGPCLSVSVNPGEWGHIARVAGPTWELTRQDAKWLDATNLGDQDIASIMDWAKTEGLAEPATIWRAWVYDGEGDSWAYLQFDSRQAAEAEVDPDDTDGAAPSDTGEAVESVPGWKLTERGMAVLERWHEPLDGVGGAIILYAMLKLAPEDPDLAGIWWDELNDPLSLSCPRGGILPGRLDLFEIRNEYGELPPFRQPQEGLEP